MDVRPRRIHGYVIVVALFLLAALLVMSGCATTGTSSGPSDEFGPAYREEAVKNSQIQEKFVEDAAKKSSDIFSFASSIYARSPKSRDDNSLVIDEGYSDRRFGDMSRFIDTAVFTIYCQTKGGEVFRWSIQGDWHAYSGFKGISKTYFTCETENAVRAVLVYEDFGRGQKYLGPMPYEQKLTLATGKYFSDRIKEYKLEGYVSSNKVVTIPETMIADPKSKKGQASEKYSMLLSFKNETRAPVEINVVDAYVTLRKERYEIDFSFRNEPIFWSSYDNLSRGVFVGTKGGYMTRLRLVPNQRFSGQVLYTIAGLPAFNEQDFAELTIVIDKFRCTDFKKMSFYDLHKERI